MRSESIIYLYFSALNEFIFLYKHNFQNHAFNTRDTQNLHNWNIILPMFQNASKLFQNAYQNFFLKIHKDNIRKKKNLLNKVQH